MTVQKKPATPPKANLSGAEASRRLKTLKRRSELLTTVYECVANRGIDGLSMRQLASAAQLSTGTINYHFENKYNLLLASLVAAYELPDDWEQYKGSPLAQLRRLVMGYVFKTSRHRFWFFWINYTAQGTRDEGMRRHQEERYTRQARFWASLLRDGIEAGELRADIDPDETAQRLLYLAHGAVIRQIQFAGVDAREEAQRILEGFLEDLIVERSSKRLSRTRKVS
ncbi:TetR family transcriptional regulator [Bradyrhizobium tropiciagri]|nr:TetR family transcriptional regulator [Bradyrhizobium tropiciagri]